VTLCASAEHTLKSELEESFFAVEQPTPHSSFYWKGKTDSPSRSPRERNPYERSKMAYGRTREHEPGYDLDVVVEHVRFRVDHRAQY